MIDSFTVDKVRSTYRSLGVDTGPLMVSDFDQFHSLIYFRFWWLKFFIFVTIRFLYLK